MSRHAAAHIAAACAVLFVAGAPLLARPLDAEAVQSRQDGTATRTRRPTATSPPGGINGVLPRCDSVDSIRVSTRQPRAGEIFTVTARSRIICPQILTSSAALFVIGGVPQGRGPNVRESMAAILDALASGRGAPIARVVVGDAATVPAWATTAEQRAVVEKALRNVEVRSGGTAAEWAAALAHTDTLFRALRPTQRPLLVVVDGRPPAAGMDDAIQDLSRAIRSSADFIGHSLLIDVSENGWLLRLAASVPGRAVVVRDTSGFDRTVVTEVQRAIAAFQAPLLGWGGSLRSSRPVLMPHASEPAADVRDRVVSWSLAAEGFAADIEVNTTYRALVPAPLVRIMFDTHRLRSGLTSEGGPGASADLCIQPRAPDLIDCQELDSAPPTQFILPPEPTPTPTPSRTRTASRTPTPGRTPSTTPERPPSPTASEETPASRRLFLPKVDRPVHSAGSAPMYRTGQTVASPQARGRAMPNAPAHPGPLPTCTPTGTAGTPTAVGPATATATDDLGTATAGATASVEPVGTPMGPYAVMMPWAGTGR